MENNNHPVGILHAEDQEEFEAQQKDFKPGIWQQPYEKPFLGNGGSKPHPADENFLNNPNY